MKTCGRCKVTKPHTEFYRNRTRPDGYAQYCRLCAIAAVARSEAKNPERRRLYGKRYRENNAAKLADKGRREYLARRARAREGRLTEAEQAVVDAVKRAYGPARYRRENADHIREGMRHVNLRYRARRLGARGDTTREQLAARWAYYGGKCWRCGVVATQTDHVIPLGLGGSHWPANLRPSCATCNTSHGGPVAAARRLLASAG